MIICICHRVSDRDIARATRQGCASFDALQDELNVATACGACHDCARETFQKHAAQAHDGTALESRTAPGKHRVMRIAGVPRHEAQAVAA